jgi:O-acetyl-ADP-ribose deacetylase (regulator of RNase III)
MTIRLAQGDLFESGADALVNPCNCVGVSGAGLAKVFATRFKPEQRQYEHVAKSGTLHLGEICVVPRLGSPRYIVYFPTKDHWKNASHLPDVEEGLRYLRGWVLSTRDVRSVAIPALGCGLGGLPWPVVRERASQILHGIRRIDIALYEPMG